MHDVRRIQLETIPIAIALSGTGHLFVEMHTKREHNSTTTLALQVYNRLRQKVYGSSLAPVTRNLVYATQSHMH
jgi:hypothetical protein